MLIRFTPPVDAPGLSLEQIKETNGIYHGTDGNFYLSFQHHVFAIDMNTASDDDNSVGDELLDGEPMTFTLIESSYTITSP